MRLKIVFWDVKHGNGAYIQTPDSNRKRFACDLGTGSYRDNKEEFSPLKYLQVRYKIKKLDEVIITHTHQDHISDILNFDDMDPQYLITPYLSKDELNLLKNEVNSNEKYSENDKKLLHEYFSIKERFCNDTPYETSPRNPLNNGGAKIKVFKPKGGTITTNNTNTRSVVTSIDYGGYKVLIPGDNDKRSWKELLENEDFEDAIRDTDIFLAPHHGRKSGYCSELFDYFTPKLTVISDGKYLDTSATDIYSKKTEGMEVYHRKNKKNYFRKCITTRNDGVIYIGIDNSEIKVRIS